VPAITPQSWRALPARSDALSDMAAEAVPGIDGAFLAVDRDGAHHLLLAVDRDIEPINDDRSRGIRALTRQLTVQAQPERHFIDVVCALPPGWDVFNLVASTIVEQIERGLAASDAVRQTLARWRRFWGATPTPGLTEEEVRGLFGELWFLAVWLLPHGHDQVGHWLGPTGARHDFAWPGLALEAKATTSVRGHLHRINGLDQLDPPAQGRLQVFSLRMREESTASNTLPSLVETITTALGDDGEALDAFESRLAQAGYSPMEAERHADARFRVVNERLYDVGEGFPRLSLESFVAGVPSGVERVEYEVNLDACPQLIVASSPSDFSPPAAPAERGGRGQ